MALQHPPTHLDSLLTHGNRIQVQVVMFIVVWLMSGCEKKVALGEIDMLEMTTSEH